MNEFDLIRRICGTLPGNESVLVGAGDDCAVLKGGNGGHDLLFKADAVVEGVHFTPATPPEKVGRKALARCLSDIAAMGGFPTAGLVTLGLPAGFDSTRIDAIYAGLNSLAREHGVAIAGGETTSSPGALFLSISLLGRVRHGRAVLRSGARPGDAIFVTGELGGSLAGKHTDFEPRLREGQWLAHEFPVHSMIDLSDGVAGDLRHILKASSCGAEILAEAIPISRAARLQARAESAAKPPLLAALTDGEDFELLFTVASGRAVALVDAWKQEFPALKLSCIGRIAEGEGIRLRNKDGVRTLTIHGYAHFGKS